MNITLYAYLNIANPMVAWEVAIGRIRSARDRHLAGFGVSTWTYGMLRDLAQKGASTPFLSELALETVRLTNHADAVSRLEGVYFFKSEADAHAAMDRWNIRHSRKCISAVNFSATRLTAVDSEWITACLQSDDRDWMRPYWEGRTMGVRPLTEILAEGIGFVMNKELRHRAYEHIIQRWPTSTPLLAMAACAFAESGLEDIAMIKPAIIGQGDTIVGSHMIDLGDLTHREVEIIASLTACKARGQLPLMIVPDDGQTFFHLPDMSDMNFSWADHQVATSLRNAHDTKG